MKTVRYAGDWAELSISAWFIRQFAFIEHAVHKVGVAIQSGDEFYSGCNVEGVWRNDIHAEINAISSMVAGGSTIIDKILIVTDHREFLPCGACMDWILQFTTEHSLIGTQKEPEGLITVYSPLELMPYCGMKRWRKDK